MDGGVGRGQVGHPLLVLRAVELAGDQGGDEAALRRARLVVDELAGLGLPAVVGRDGRRLRPNIVIGGVEGLQEFDWAGRELRVADVRIHLHSRRGRCPMTTVDPDTLEVDPGVLQDILRRFNGRLALNAAVVRGGRIAVGDEVRVTPGRA